jgi:hypothetical protein
MRSFGVGQLVRVDSRTGPGMNQPGGVGRIVRVHDNDDRGMRQYSVKYVVDSRTEHHLDEEYVHAHEFAVSKFRDRRLLLGRCRRCGSLRTDCGSCENDIAIRMEEELPNRAIPHKIRRKPKKTAEQSDSDDEEEDSIDGLAAHSDSYYQRYYKKFKRFEKQAKLFGLDELSSKSSSCSDSHGEDEKITSDSSDDSSSLFLKSLVLSQAVRRNTLHVRRKVRAILDESDSHNSNSSSLDGSLDKNRQDHAKSKNLWMEGGVLAATAALTASPRKHAKQKKKHLTGSTPQTQTIFMEYDSIEPYNATVVRRHSVGDRNDSGITQTNHNETAEIDESETPRQTIGSRNHLENPLHPDFLQPEGEADELPADIHDQTKHLSYPDLMQFFDGIVQRLEGNEIPNHKIQVIQLEREWKHASNETEKRDLYRKRYERKIYHQKYSFSQNSSIQTA